MNPYACWPKSEFVINRITDELDCASAKVDAALLHRAVRFD
jgi:hypothetical protein